MADSCLFPNCKLRPQSNGYCIGHKDYSSFTAVKVSKGVKKVSDTRKEDKKIYLKIVKEMLARDNRCKVKSEVCSKIATGLHHTKKRDGDNYLNKRFLIPSCNPCNNFLETAKGQAWGRSRGFVLSKFKKEEI